MQSESNHIDNFFRRKEAASVTDDSNVNAHWKQMQEMMSIHAVSKTPKTISYKIILKYAAIILLLAAGVLFVLQNKKANKDITIKPSNEKVTYPASSTSPVNSIGVLSQQPIDTGAIINDQQLAKKAIQKTKTGNDKIAKLRSTQDSVPGNKSLALSKEEEKKHDNAVVFKTFNTEIKKQPEHFKLNTTRDTTLVCKEGTTVFVPANAFQTMNGEPVSEPVTFSIKEFYNIADIISNNLSTVSNGKQLVTGGMLNIAAFANDKPLQIKPGSFIDIKMPTRVFNAQMQLFTGQENSLSLKTMNQDEKIVKGTVNYETKTIQVDSVATENSQFVTSPFFNEAINWIPAGQQQFFFDGKDRNITILDIQDNSRVVWRGDRSVAKYLIPNDCPLSTDEIQKILAERYGRRYDEIKVRRAWKPWSKKRRISKPINWTNWLSDEYFVGDSVVMPLNVAMRRKLITREDSLRYEMEFKKRYEEAIKRRDAYSAFVQQRKSYEFRITGLGWINCDRFLDYPPGRLSDFYVKTPEGYEGNYFTSMLIFENSRSAMSGYWNTNGRINFAKLPLGEMVNVVCLGAKDGKMYASVQQLRVERQPNITLTLEEVTPEEFKQKLSIFGSVQNLN